MSMRRWWWLGLSLSLAVGIVALARTETEAQGRCACAPARCEASLRNARGCCPLSSCEGSGGSGSATKARRPRSGSGGGSTSGPAAAARGCSDGMVRIPGGTFWMGSPDGQGEADEHPQHRVTVSAFCMDRTEVTVGAYQQCVLAGTCPPAPTTVNFSGFSAEDATFWSQFCNGSRQDRQDHPVNCVDWTMSDTYCRWRSARLPTEAEWEYAARGTDGRTYPWGESAPDGSRLNVLDTSGLAALRQAGRSFSSEFAFNDGHGLTAPVGSYPAGASPWGVLDLAGNVNEWTGDWYGAYPAGDVDNPRGASSGEYRVSRGGGWDVILPARVRAAIRGWSGPAVRSDLRGFRCARGA